MLRANGALSLTPVPGAAPSLPAMDTADLFYPTLTSQQLRVQAEEGLVEMLRADRKFCSQQLERVDRIIALMESGADAFTGLAEHYLGGHKRAGKAGKLSELEPKAIAGSSTCAHVPLTPR